MSRPVRPMLGVGVALAAAQYVPSVVTLAQWGPWQALPWGLCRWQGPASPGEGGVALTFDDGPHPEGTPAALDALDRLGLRATFFCLGSNAERHPQLVDEILRRGHEVETHGYLHRHHLARSPRWVLHDLRQARDVMRNLGVQPRWYRPSYGQASGSTLVLARALGLRPVLWSAWGREWATDDPGAVAARISRRLRSGSIVLLHDSDDHGPEGMWRTGLGALERVAEHLEQCRLQAMTIDELVGPGA
jgi:peptidoglycan-N-acetylglucosamine deacetylase